jgi:hypothetical protein
MITLKHPLLAASLLSALSLSAQPTEIQAEFDTTLDFWAGYTTSWQDNQQGYVSNANWGPFAGDAQYQTRYEYIGQIIRFDLTGVSAETVNAADFKAELDVMFHGFARDEPNDQLVDLLTPEATEQQLAGWGDGLSYLTVHRMISDYANSANRWMKRPESGNFTDWEDDTNIPPVENIDGFSEANFDINPVDTITFKHGWSAELEDTSGLTAPNEFGQLVWDITELVRGWVNGDYPNNGLMVWMDPARSLNEQVNLLTIDTPPGDRGFPVGGAAPLLRLTTATVGDPTWAGYDVMKGDFVDTENFLGWLWVGSPTGYVFSYSLENYIYLPEENVSDSGAWAYAPKE